MNGHNISANLEAILKAEIDSHRTFVRHNFCSYVNVVVLGL